MHDPDNQNPLINLRYRLEQAQAGDPWFTAVRVLNIENGPLDQYKQALEQLQSKVEAQDGAQKLKRRLFWKFSKTEVAGIRKDGTVKDFGKRRAWDGPLVSKCAAYRDM